MSRPQAHEPAAAGGAVQPRQVRCPNCGQAAIYAPSNPWRPFCSARCRGADLGAWATEDYRVPAAPPSDPDEGPPG
jgi:endogenous inhibitor of DNA gyrase (YacG/DUF329 family)